MFPPASSGSDRTRPASGWRFQGSADSQVIVSLARMINVLQLGKQEDAEAEGKTKANKVKLRNTLGIRRWSEEISAKILFKRLH